MSDEVIITEFEPPLAEIVFNDPPRRNAMNSAMFDALDWAIDAARCRADINVVLLRGNGPAFCAGFDLAAAVDEPAVLETYILRLSGVIGTLRRMPQVVVAAAHGAAIAGGCALLSASDVAVVEKNAKIGYPVHRLGISPAVSAATLMQAIGPGPARALMLAGRLIDGGEALRLGLASHCCDDASATFVAARQLCQTLADHGPRALRATKRWINELDGSLDDDRYHGPATDTGRAALHPDSIQKLRDFWAARHR